MKKTAKIKKELDELLYKFNNIPKENGITVNDDIMSVHELFNKIIKCRSDLLTAYEEEIEQEMINIYEK